MPAGRLRILVVDCGSSRVGRIETALLDLGASVTTRLLEEAAESLSHGVDGVVISGGPRLFTGPEGPALRRAFGFLQTPSVPVLGICLGHQAIGLQHGVEVARGAERRGPEQVEILEEHPLVAGLPVSATFVADHVEGIALPTGFRRLARSRHYDVEAMADDALGLFGVQFHPEDSGEGGNRLFANFLGLVRAAGGR